MSQNLDQKEENGKNVKFHDSVYENVSLRTNKSQNARRSRRQALVWSTVQDSLIEEHQLLCFKIRKSSIIKVIFWVTLVTLFYFGY